jgi:conjugation transfer TcpE-like protein
VSDGRLVIRSYRRVFRVDRRIYRVDRWALPVPGGVPLRGVVYFACALLIVIAAGEVPLIGDLVGLLNPPLRYVIVPLAIAVLGAQAAPDGRSAHRFAGDWMRARVRRRRRCAGRPVPLEGESIAWHGSVAVRWDDSASGLRRARVTGPARVSFADPVRVERRNGRFVVRSGDGVPVRELGLRDGLVMEVHR